MMRNLMVVALLFVASWPVQGQTFLPAPNLPSPGNPTAPRFPTPGTLPNSLIGDQPAMVLPGQATSEPVHGLTKFDHRSVQIRVSSGRYELAAGNLTLQNFGNNVSEARAALDLIQSLRLTERGTVGNPKPIMEYWLAEGKGPAPLSLIGLRTAPVDTISIRAEHLFGHWVVRDNNRIFFNFGLGRDEAQQAAQVIRQHGFNRIGYIGHPKPLMIYFLTDPFAVAAGTNLPESNTQTSFIKLPSTNQSAQEIEKLQTLAALQSIQQLARGYGQMAPAMTEEAMRFRFEARDVKMHLEGKCWQLRHEDQVIGEFGQDFYQAQQVLSWLQQYGCNEVCQIGHPKVVFTYFLVNGAAPRGAKFSLSGQSFHPGVVSLKQFNNAWYLYENGNALLPLGTQKRDAEQALQVIRRYGFDFIGQPVGLSTESKFSFLVRMK